MIGPVFVIFCDWTCFCLVNSGGDIPKPTICDLCFCLVTTMARVEPGPSDKAEDISSGILVDL